MWSFAMIVSTYFESLSPQARVGSVFWRGRRVAEAREVVVISQSTHVLPLEFSRRYPVLVRGEGLWVDDASGKRYLDAMSGASMAATLGHGRRDIIAAARAQAEKLAYVHNERLTNPAQEQLAHELAGLPPKGFTRVRFVTGGAEANEMALQIARRYHVDRGDSKRWQVISPAQAYHGPTMATLALTGRPGLQGLCEPYLTTHHHIPPSTWRFDPTGEQALQALDRALEAAGHDAVSAYFCEPVSGAALSCAVGLKVIDILRKEGLVDHVRERGPRLREELAAALKGLPLVHEVRGRGVLLGG